MAAKALAIIVNPSNDVKDLKASQVQDLVMGRVAVWPNGRRVTVVLPGPESADHAQLLAACCRVSPDAFRRLRLQASFQGDAAAQTKTASSSSLIKRFVAITPGAVGFIPADEVDSSVTTLRIGGRAPSDAGYALAAP